MSDCQKSAVVALDVIFEDEHFIAINKPAGMLVHRGERNHLAAPIALQSLREHLGHHVFPVHRLDKMTSGVLLFAKHSECASLMAQQWHASDKQYLAVVRGYMPDTLHLDYAMSPPIDKLKKRPKQKPPQTAITDFVCLNRVELPIEIDKYPQSRYSFVRVLPKTGRKHQIRRHLKHVNHPIIGDTRYGKGKHTQYFRDHMAVNRMLLHASQLSIQHPYFDEMVTLNADLDTCWRQLLERFNWSLSDEISRLSDKSSP